MTVAVNIAPVPRCHMAQGGGPEADKLEAAIDAIRRKLKG